MFPKEWTYIKRFFDSKKKHYIIFKIDEYVDEVNNTNPTNMKWCYGKILLEHFGENETELIKDNSNIELWTVYSTGYWARNYRIGMPADEYLDSGECFAELI